MSGQLISQPTIGVIGQSTGNAGTVSVVGNGAVADAAFMQFHRPGVYASYFGLDTDNAWKVGGWSAGAVSYRLFHENYFPSSAVTNALGYTPIQQGGGALQGGNKIYIGWSGSKIKAQVDATDMGSIALENQYTSFNSTPSDTAAQLAIVGSSGGQGVLAKLRMFGTFLGVPTDLGNRLMASIRSGFTGTWGTEFLDIFINSTANDAVSDANQTQVARFTSTGLKVNNNLTVGNVLEVGSSAIFDSWDVRFKPNSTGVAGISVIARNDGNNFYLLTTASGDALGTFNGLRPFAINVATGVVQLNDAIALTRPINDDSTYLATTGFVRATRGGYSGLATTNAALTLTNSVANQAIQSYGATLTITLPVGSTMPANSKLTFYNHGTGLLTIAKQGTDFIYAGFDVGSVVIPIGGTLELLARGNTEYDIVGGSAALQYASSLKVQTQATADNSTLVASTAFVKAQGYITSAGAPVQSVFGRAGAVTLTSADVTGALAFTPYNATNPSSYITATGAPVQSVFGRAGAVTLAGADVTTALGFTPYNATNPSSYITAAGAPVQSVFGRAGAVILAGSDVTGALGYTPIQSGTGIGQNLANTIKIGWSLGSRLKATVDVTDMGNFALEGTANSFTAAQTITTSGSTNTLSLVDTGASGSNFKLAGNGTVTPSKTIRAQAGNLEVVNSAYTAIVATISDGGNLNLAGSQLLMNQVPESDLVLGNSGGYFFGSAAGAGWYKPSAGYVRWDAATGDFTTTGKINSSSIITANASASDIPLVINQTAGNNLKIALQDAGVNKGFIAAGAGGISFANAANTVYNMTVSDPGNMTLRGNLTTTGVSSSGEVQSTNINSFRSVQGNYGVFLRNDGGSAYLLQTASADALGSFNGYRPFSWDLGTGTVRIADNGSTTIIGGPLNTRGQLVIDTSSANSTHYITNTGTNGVQIKLLGNGTTTPGKTLRAVNGVLDIVNNAYTAAILSLTDSGNVGIAGNLTTTGVSSSGEVQSTNVNSFRSVYGNYGTFIRNDGISAYLMQTASADAYGSFNGNRPFSWDLASGIVRIADNGSATFIGGVLKTKATIGVLGQAAGGLANLEVYGGGTGNAAFMQFHRPNEYASYFGLDTDNKWKVGGWSAGAVSYELHHDGNSVKGGSGSFASGGAAQVGTLNLSGQLTIDTTSSNLTHQIQNTGTNGVQIKMVGNGTTTPSKILRVTNGVLDIVNSAYTASILTLEDSGNVTIPGNLAITGVGSGLKVKEGTNAKQGVVTLSNGSVVVSNTSVTADSRIFLCAQGDVTYNTSGFLRVSARTAGTSFTISSSSSSDISVVAYQIFEPA